MAGSCVSGRALFGTTPERGAETLVYLASSPDVEGVTGQYFAKKGAIESSPASHDFVAQRRLWQLSDASTRSFVWTGYFAQDAV